MSFIRAISRPLSRPLAITFILPPLTSSLHISPLRSRAQDPFPLPFSDSSLAASQSSQDPEQVIESWQLPPPLDRTGESPKALRARLIYQTRKRGTLETDLLLSTFARDALPDMSVEEMQEFDKLLDEPDWDIFYWAVQKKDPPPRWANTKLLQRLIKHARNEGKEVRKMPELMQQEP